MESSRDQYSEHLAMLVRERVLTYKTAQETLEAIRYLLGSSAPSASVSALPFSESALRRARFIMGQIDEAAFLAPSKRILFRASLAYGFVLGLTVAAIPLFVKFALDKPVPMTGGLLVGGVIGVGAGVAAAWVWRRLMFEYLFRRHASRLVHDLHVRPSTEP